jgi:dTDP-4-dehydrorhamnose 3,5-epimerase-like enzyme
MTPITIRSMRRIAFRQHHADGTLTVFPAETTGVPFSIRRVFTISGVSPHGARGNHAHRDCSQMLACLSGQIVVTVHDGFETIMETVNDDGVSLLIPPMLWNSVRFDGPSTVLAVFCDELYDADDYVTDWNEFVHLKAAERATIQQWSKS